MAFSHVQKGAVIGKGCSFGQNVNISNNVKIGNGVKVQNNVSIYEGVELEDYVFCGPSMVFTNDLTPRAKYPKGQIGYKKTLLKHGATVGANATIVCGHTIGCMGNGCSRCSSDKRCSGSCPCCGSSCKTNWLGV